MGQPSVSINGKKVWIDLSDGGLLLRNVQINSIKDIGGLDEISDVIRTLHILESPMTSLDGIEMLPDLEIAVFSNHLRSLEGIQACTKIDYLKVNDNEIDSMAPLASLARLKFVELRNNRIERIEGLAGNQALESLDLSKNRIPKIEGLSGCENLKRLDLSNNRIERIECLEDMPALEDLHLTNNKIARIENLEYIPSLKSLELSGNHIRKIENIENCAYLDYLGLGSNKIERLENLESIVADVRLGGNKESIDTELDLYSGNAVLCYAFKDGLDRMCADLETRVADHVAGQLANQGYIGNVIPEPRQHVDSYLHVGDAFMLVSGHPAGEKIDVNTYYSRVMDKGGSNSKHVRDLATRVLGAIVGTACFFGMFEERDKDVSSLVPFTNFVEDLDLVPDVRGWAAFLRKGAAPILTLRWPEWPISDWNGMISNDIVVVNESVKSRWRYMKGAFYFLSREGPIIKEFYGRTYADWRAADIQVFKEEDVAGLSWDDFLARLESFRTMGRDQYHVFRTVDDFREFLKKTL